MNCVTPEFVKARGLVAGSIQDLNNHSGCIPINGAGGKRTEPLGYVMIRVQILQVPSYDEGPSGSDRRRSVLIFSTMSRNTRKLRPYSGPSKQ